MKKLNPGHGGIISLALFLVFLTGCDKIPFLQEYFTPKERQTPAPLAAPTPQAPSEPAAAPADKPLAANELARVGDWSITLDEFNERLVRLKEVVPDFDIEDMETKRLILDELIRQQLLVSDAEARGITGDKDIRDAVEEFRRTLLVREVAASITDEITVSEQEASEYYEQNKEALADPSEWHVREIVVNDEAAAKDILVALYGGADFAQTARERSTGATAANGGDLGFINQMPFPQMESALQALEPGGISSVIKGPEGKFYIIKLEEVRGGEPRPFEELKEEIIRGLTLLKQQQAIVEHLNRLAEKIPTKVNENLLEKQ